MKNLQKLYDDAGIDLKNDRWSAGIEHHPKSIELMKHLEFIDFNYYGDYFCFKVGGDGDNGETLMYEMDNFFEMKDKLAKEDDKK